MNTERTQTDGNRCKEVVGGLRDVLISSPNYTSAAALRCKWQVGAVWAHIDVLSEALVIRDGEDGCWKVNSAPTSL